MCVVNISNTGELSAKRQVEALGGEPGKENRENCQGGIFWGC